MWNLVAIKVYHPNSDARGTMIRGCVSINLFRIDLQRTSIEPRCLGVLSYGAK